MTDFFTQISNFGFPIVVAGYLLFRFENKIESFGNKVERFSEVIEGKPSENKIGLIGSIEKNTKTTQNLVNVVNKLTRKK